MEKTVVLLGDSIRLGYCERVKACLEGVSVYYPEENCRNTQYLLTQLSGYAAALDPKTVVSVLFNCGHWDAAHFGGSSESLTSEEEYRRNLGILVHRLRALFPKASLFFATTTPMNPKAGEDRNPRTNEEIDRYNTVAREVMKREGVEVLDLNAFTRAFSEESFADGCHFTKEASRLLGDRVAAFLKQRL